MGPVYHCRDRQHGKFMLPTRLSPTFAGVPIRGALGKELLEESFVRPRPTLKRVKA
jgi:hypothetical protein